MRRELTSLGVRESQPVAYLLARVHASNCATIEWPDSEPWLRVGEEGYVEGALAPSDQWINGRPTFIVPDAESFPYPRRYLRSINRPLSAEALRGPFASAVAFLDYRAMVYDAQQETMRWRRGKSMAEINDERGAIVRERVLAWARVHRTDADRVPLRDEIRRLALAIQATDWQGRTSRLSGTYRLRLTAADTSVVVWLRSARSPLTRWDALDSGRAIADVVARPTPSGYVLDGVTVSMPDSLAGASLAGARSGAGGWPVWLSFADRALQSGGDNASSVRAEVRLRLGGVPAHLWPMLGRFVPLESARDSAARAQVRIPAPRAGQYAQLPLTVHATAEGQWHGDTTIKWRDGSLRIELTRVDTMTVTRLY